MIALGISAKENYYQLALHFLKINNITFDFPVLEFMQYLAFIISVLHCLKKIFLLYRVATLKGGCE